MRRIGIILLMMVIAPALAFAGKIDESQMMRGAKLLEKQPQLPTVVVGGNTVIGNVTRPGWPIIVSAAMDSDADPAPAVPSNLNVKLMDQNGQAVAINFESVTREDKTQQFWIAEATQNLVPGQYTITLVPTDEITVESGELEVQSNPENVPLLDYLKIQLALLMGKDDEAIVQADQMIAKDPNDRNTWIAKGDILMAQDLPDQAGDAYEKAFELGRPSIYLQERMSYAFRRSLEKRGVLKGATDSQP